MVSSPLLSHDLIPTLLTRLILYSLLKKKGLKNIKFCKVPLFKQIMLLHRGSLLVQTRTNPIFTIKGFAIVAHKHMLCIPKLQLLSLDQDPPLVHPTVHLHLGITSNIFVKFLINLDTLLIPVGIGLIHLTLILLLLMCLNIHSQSMKPPHPPFWVLLQPLKIHFGTSIVESPIMSLKTHLFFL